MRGAVGLDAVWKAFDGTPVVRGVSLDVRPGEFLTLLGPSGCGKTTLLRLVAGFERPDRGRVRLSGADVTDRPPYARPVNTVFQHYALFPHRDVDGNVRFGLEMARRPAAEMRARVARALELVRLGGFESRRIDQLSGGQKQRVALARAMVLEPEVLLLDEPLAALDLKLRQEMQVELKNLQERSGLTFIFVTHDQDEALVMSDRIAVMNRGLLEQLDTPEALYERPRTRFVADFLGVRNLLAAEVLGPPAPAGEPPAPAVRLRTRAGLELVARDDGGYPRGGTVWVGVRPERLALSVPGAGGVPAILEDEIYLGDHSDWRVRAAGEVLTVTEPATLAATRARGDALALHIPPEAVLRLEDSEADAGAGGEAPAGPARPPAEAGA